MVLKQKTYFYILPISNVVFPMLITHYCFISLKELKFSDLLYFSFNVKTKLNRYLFLVIKFMCSPGAFILFIKFNNF